MHMIKSSAQISEIFDLGTRFNSGDVRIIVKQVDNERGPLGRVAFIAGKKLGNAVARNRSKRVLRAAAYGAGLPAQGYDILLIATPRTRSSSSADVQKSLERLLARAGLR